MQEMLPIASGLVFGGMFAAMRVPIYIRVLLIVILATCATVASGEFRLSWAFLLPDVVEVAVSSVAGFFAVRAWRRYAAQKG